MGKTHLKKTDGHLQDRPIRHQSYSFRLKDVSQLKLLGMGEELQIQAVGMLLPGVRANGSSLQLESPAKHFEEVMRGTPKHSSD